MEKSYDSVKLIGTLAVERGWVSQEDVKFALEKQKTGKFFGEILLNKQLITLQQLEELLKLQEEAEIRQEDFLFGQIAVHNRFLKAEDIVEGLEQQKKNKFRESLGELLKKQGLLNVQQCEAILSSQARLQKSTSIKNKKISCPKCNTYYQIKETERYRKVRCKNCQYIFEVGSQKIKVSVDSVSSTEGPNKNTLEIESKSLIQFLKENDLTPQNKLSDSSDIIVREDARYVLGKEIARGGMGKILMTKDVNLRRNIVTKVLLNKKSKLATLRFIEEAQITGQLEHPNIPPVYDLGVNKDENIFFTMKHIKGETLENILRQFQENESKALTKYSYKTISNIFVKVCNALEFAHSKNVIHRDIKPENIMVGEYGEVLLMDWGLAKIIGSAEEFEELDEVKISSVRSEDESSNTMQGTTAGTPVFMSPEQASGYSEKMDQRSDVYSLGATLFCILELTRPIIGLGIHEVLLKAMEGEIQEFTRNVPSELKAITLKAMAFKPSDRYQTINEMEKDLINYQMGYSVSAKQDSPLEMIRKFYLRNKLLTMVSAIFTIVFIVGGIGFIISLKSQMNLVIQQKQIADNSLLKAEEALSQFEKEKQERMADNKSSAPSLYAKALLETQMTHFEEAERLMDTALSYDKSNLEYKLFRGCLAISNSHFSKAKADLIEIKNNPNQKQISELLTLLNTSKLKEFSETQKMRVSEIFTEIKFFDIAQKYTSDVNKKLETWNNKLKENWEMANIKLSMNQNKLTFYSANPNRVDYSLLAGIPIQVLVFNGCKLANLSFIENMPLEELTLFNCPVKDLSALKNIKLKYLKLENGPIKDLSPLENAELNTLILKSVAVTSLKPVLRQPIKNIDFFGLQLNDITELKNFKLEQLSLNYCKITDINFIDFTQMKYFLVNNSELSDISRLKEAPLEFLDLAGCGIKDISPLQNKDIITLNINGSGISNLEILLTLKKLETLIVNINNLPPNWEPILLKMAPHLKQVGPSLSTAYLKPLEQFITENKGFNNKNRKK
jgi:serine/threonine protein kinase